MFLVSLRMKKLVMKFFMNICIIFRIKLIQNISLFCLNLSCFLENAMILAKPKIVKKKLKKLLLILFLRKVYLIYVMNFTENLWSLIIFFEYMSQMKKMKLLKLFNIFVFGFLKMNIPNLNYPWLLQVNIILF